MKNKRFRAVYVIALVLGVTALLLGICMTLYAKSFEHEYVAKSFSEDRKFSQFTLFLPEDADFTIDKIMYFRYNLENKLVEKAITAENEDARLYVDAFSTYKDVSLTSDKRTSKSKTAYIGGDYALFHKEFDALPVITNDLNHDRMLLSRSASWQLYGGTSLYDYPVSVGKKTLYISGVYPDYTDKDSARFYGDTVSATADIFSEPQLPVTCYEIILVDPVKNFALETIKSCLSLTDGTYLLVENSKRFSVANLLEKAGSLVAADKQLPTGVSITPKEIAARRAEKVLAIMLVAFLLIAAFPVLVLLYLAYRLVKLVKHIFNRFVVTPIKDKLSYS